MICPLMSWRWGDITENPKECCKENCAWWKGTELDIDTNEFGICAIKRIAK